MLAQDTVLLAADENLIAHVQHLARSDPAATMKDDDGLILVAGSHPHPGPYRNMAFSLGMIDPDEAVTRAREFFAERSRSFVFWAPHHDHTGLSDALAPFGQLLEDDGLPELYSREPPPLADPPDGVTLETVTERAQMREFLEVNVAGWGMEGMPFDVARAAFFEPTMLEHPNVRAILARRDGQAVACAMCHVYRGVAGGYWGATIPEARRQGFGDLVVRAMWNAGFGMGAHLAVNQASGSGKAIWERMGFQEITRYNRYLVSQRS